MRRLVGYDLNGWRDLAARNWMEQPGEDDSGAVELVVSGGIGGVVVGLGEAGCDLMGGAQALRAPHGLGPGWGPVGAADRRARVVDLLADPGAYVAALAAALRGMADPAGTGWRGPTTAVLAIPDAGAYENEQEALIRTLRALRVTGDSLLVWRPVLACLAALDAGFLGEVEQVGVVGHTGPGLTAQRLRIRHDRDTLAPERRSDGRLHAWDGGLFALEAHARRALVAASATPDRADHLAAARCLVPLALGDAPGAEAVRLASGGWEVVAPDPFAPALPPIPPTLVEQLADCEIVLLDTPTAGAMRAALVDVLSSGLPTPVCPLPHEAIARGGLVAAGRIARGEPTYFDFLPQLSTIIQDAMGARSFDLIGPEEVLPAGRVYRSPNPARLGLAADATTIRIYLRKQKADACRIAEVPLAAPTGRTTTVKLDVEQAPAAGRARLSLTSDAFPTPLQVDWERAEILQESWEELLESLQRTTPAIPNRVVLSCGLDVWHGRNGSDGLEALLRQNANLGRYDWGRLAGMMSARPYGRYAISSDGALPDGLSTRAVADLAAATAAAEDDVHARLDGTVEADNGSLKFLTWQFHRCPRWLLPPLLEALEAPTGRHPFVWHHANRQLIYHALGRIVRDDPEDADMVAKILDHLVALPEGTWNRDSVACAGFLLSRTDTAPALLDADRIRRVALEAERLNKAAIGGRYTSSYLYVPIVLVGLLRHRRHEPWLLVAGQDPLADGLRSSTEAVIDDMQRRFPGDPRVGRYRAILSEVCDWLSGEGRNPDLLIDLSNLAGG